MVVEVPPALPKRTKYTAKKVNPDDIVDDTVDDETEDQAASFAVKQTKKRALDKVEEEEQQVQPDVKKGKSLDSDDVDATQQEPQYDDSEVPPAAPVAQKVQISPYIVYPNQYKDGFDTSKMCFEDPVASTKGGGQLMFMAHNFTDTNAATGVTYTVKKPFLWNTPNGMFLPAGFHTWEDGKITLLASCGERWQENPLMKAQIDAFEAIRRRCIEAVIEKEWNSPFPNTYEAIEPNFTAITFVGLDPKTGKEYPPSIKISYIQNTQTDTVASAKTTTKGKGAAAAADDKKTRTKRPTKYSEIYEYAPVPPLKPLLPVQVAKGSQGTIVQHFAWVYRKKTSKCHTFSIRINLFQLVAEAPSALGGGGVAGDASGDRVCSVQY